MLVLLLRLYVGPPLALVGVVYGILGLGRAIYLAVSKSGNTSQCLEALWIGILSLAIGLFSAWQFTLGWHVIENARG